MRGTCQRTYEACTVFRSIFFGTGKFYWASSFNDVGQPCFVIIFCEILKKPFLHIIVLLPANSIYSCFLKEMFHGTISTIFQRNTRAFARPNLTPAAQAISVTHRRFFNVGNKRVSVDDFSATKVAMRVWEVVAQKIDD